VSGRRRRRAGRGDAARRRTGWLKAESGQRHSDTFVPYLFTSRKALSDPPKTCALAKKKSVVELDVDTPVEK
jgi:hypothetical protein